MPSSKNVAAKPFSQSRTTSFVSSRTLANQKFFELDKQVVIIWCKVGTVWGMLEISHVNFGAPPLSRLAH
jgi:hypothetical protein